LSTYYAWLIVYNKYKTWYHIFVAGKKTTQKSGNKTQIKGSQAIVIFWLIFFIIVVSIFMANWGTIQRNFDLFKTRITTPPGTEDPPLVADEQPPDPVVQITSPETRSPSRQDTTPPQTRPAEPTPPRPLTDRPANPPSDRPATPTQPPPPPAPPVQIRDRNIYFTQIDKDGQILQSRVARKIPVSDTPMIDTLNVLFTGPSTDELGKGLLNLVPHNTRILSATVRGSTAYISFSEEFMFNTFGVEGYVAQLRQIVWTVTEFPNVKDVQVLIEGKRIDYLADGIWVGSPISRQSF
jgi:hypothetical protein